MKLMIFIDSDNFRNNIKNIKLERNQDRIIDFYKIHKFVQEYLSNNLQYKGCTLTHIRTYVYTGEYTDPLFKKIKDAIKYSDGEEKTHFEKILEVTTKKADGQKNFLKKSSTFYFFEVRKKPLQFSKNKGIFQKGVDVQLAVDLVSNAYLNTYDIAILFSGDIDLLESIKNVKNLGKQVIIFSHDLNIAREMIREADMFVDIQKLKDFELDKFTHIYENKKPNTNNIIKK